MKKLNINEKKRKLVSDYFKVQNKITTIIDKTDKTEETKDNPGLKPETTQPEHITSMSVNIDLNNSNEDKLEILNNIWVPESNYIFPKVGNRNLKFQYQWLQKWHWLAYSSLLNGALCKFCVLYSRKKGGIGDQALGVLCTVQFNSWKNAIEKFSLHEMKEYHKNCIITVQTLRHNVSMLDQSLKDKISFNRKLIIPVIETIILCGRQGLAMRGLNDSGPLALNFPIENDGNFRSILRNTLNHNKELFEVRPTTQNEIINSCQLIILNKIVSDINKSQCFSILADETADVSDIEQFSLIESFLLFVPVSSTTGSNLSLVIIDTLKSIGIDLKYLKGQGYDGAACMSGKFNGVQQLIKNHYPQALYVYCSAHSFNLVVSTSFAMPPIRNTMELYPAIISSLEILSDDSDRETSSKASNLLISIQDFQFLTMLQKTQIDLGVALTYATHLSSELKKIRDNADNKFKIIFNQILNLSEKYNITIKTPRLSKKQVHRNNIPCNDTETYYRIAIFIPFLDTFLQSIEDRFVNHKHIFTGFQYINM
ncbi:zinc finger MYM-type protein 1-like [Aphis craccivora]|uniref:Zinc finger MYM-type protein 1-like n=1 Tax=Aphis craccivora TaxID=307492 RepID=A0A6G0YCJ0_APHCR|nr:zinc finger MYM-type protein 1-like [Aphis craccivora]